MSIIAEIWSDRYLVRLERQIWISVMRSQNQLDPELVKDKQIQRSISCMNTIHLDSIRRRELVTKHDIKARIEEFAALSGHDRVHLGMTSADIVENTYAIRIKRSCGSLKVPCSLPLRGIRGPLGNDVDQMDLFGSAEAVSRINDRLASVFSFDEIYNAPDQCMPRAFDAQIAGAIVDRLQGPERMVGVGLLSMLSHQEYWMEGDVSSSCVRRYAWPLLFKLLEGTYMEDYPNAQT